MPSTLALYNYKLEGVTDGPYSFGKASDLIQGIVDTEVDTELQDIESATVSQSSLKNDEADAEVRLVTVQLPLGVDS